MKSIAPLTVLENLVSTDGNRWHCMSFAFLSPLFTFTGYYSRYQCCMYYTGQACVYGGHLIPVFFIHTSLFYSLYAIHVHVLKLVRWIAPLTIIEKLVSLDGNRWHCLSLFDSHFSLLQVSVPHVRYQASLMWWKLDFFYPHFSHFYRVL